MLKKIIKSFSVLLILSFSGCSSAPKRVMAVYDVYDNASQLYQVANNLIILGNYSDAATNLHSAYSMAVKIDNYELICKICLSTISLKLAVPKDFKMPSVTLGLPVLNLEVEKLLTMAKDSASRSSDKDFLLSVCSIFNSQIEINRAKPDYDSIISEMKKNESAIMKDPYYAGIFERTIGDIYVLQKNYPEAEKRYKKAVDIHTSNRYLYEISQDWYNLARTYSQNGKKNEAKNAILIALKYDKDGENTCAIGQDYYAFALIMMKEPFTKEELELAQRAANQSSLVFAAGNFNIESERSYQLSNSIKDKLSVLF